MKAFCHSVFIKIAQQLEYNLNKLHIDAEQTGYWVTSSSENLVSLPIFFGLKTPVFYLALQKPI